MTLACGPWLLPCRFKYSRDFLQWALHPPGFYPQWHVGVRVSGSGKLVGFITGVPANVQVAGKVLSVAEINFLCVHKKLRSKRLAPVLIKVGLQPLRKLTIQYSNCL